MVRELSDSLGFNGVCFDERSRLNMTGQILEAVKVVSERVPLTFTSLFSKNLAAEDHTSTPRVFEVLVVSKFKVGELSLKINKFLLRYAEDATSPDPTHIRDGTLDDGRCEMDEEGVSVVSSLNKVNADLGVLHLSQVPLSVS